MPPNFTETSRISSAACGSRRAVTGCSVAGADKVTTFLFEEHGSRRAGESAGRHEGGSRLPAEALADQCCGLRDPAADAVGIAADADSRDAGEQELVVQDVRQVWHEDREQRER